MLSLDFTRAVEQPKTSSTGQPEKHSGIRLAADILRKAVPDKITKDRAFLPLTQIDLLIEAPAYFTVAVVSTVEAPQTGKSGKRFITVKVTDLVKHDLVKLQKQCFPQLIAGGDAWTRMKVLKTAEKSFNTDGYKQLRILAFGDELVKTVYKRLEVGMVVAFADLKQLDYSENSGVAMRIEAEDQVYPLGKSSDMVFCKGIVQKAGAPVTNPFSAASGLQSGKGCGRFLNKQHQTTCDQHSLEQQDHKLSRIISSRGALHSDHIDINKTQRLQREEFVEKKFKPVNSILQAQKKVIISPRSKALEEKRMSKEIEKYDQYFKERT